MTDLSSLYDTLPVEAEDIADALVELRESQGWKICLEKIDDYLEGVEAAVWSSEDFESFVESRASRNMALWLRELPDALISLLATSSPTGDE